METYNRIEFRAGGTFEQEMFFKPFFELKNRKVIQVEKDIFPRFFRLSVLLKKTDVYLSSNFKVYYSVQKFEEGQYKRDLSSGIVWDDILGEVVKERK